MPEIIRGIRPNRDEVDTAVTTIKRLLRFAQKSFSSYGDLDGITLEDVDGCEDLFTESVDIIEALNDALPSHRNG